ncbi:hypothetical protein [Maribacter sp. R86514]|uniref:lipase family protein n=1 Tax=Maribacter sp. R86514 TaxID=3093854 RepID=UPI0037C7E8F0
MKITHFLKTTFFILLLSTMAFGQRSKELKCFDNFEYNNSNKSRANAYLLAMVNYYMYPHNLLGVASGASESVNLSRHNDQFEAAFKLRMEPWFQTNRLGTIAINNSTKFSSLNGKVLKKVNQTQIKTPRQAPIIEFISETNGAGYDPEVMLISTAEYIILAWRGTDRVSSNTPILGGAIFQAGEWVQTNFDFPLVNAPSGIPGRVHRGFSTSVNYNNLLGRLADRLIELDVNNKNLWITGHSLGGAHAQISSLYLKEQHDIQPFAVYSYAAPAVGDQRFCNAIEAVVPGSKLQRFRYIYDPVPTVPSSLLPGMSDYRKAGQLNYFKSEQGSKNYHYDYKREPKYPMPFFCHHNPHWYARAAYFELIDKTPGMNSKVPDAPDMPTEGCTPLDQQMAEGHYNFLSSIRGIDDDLEPGTYYIINAKTGGYLNIHPNDFNESGRPIGLDSFRTDRRFKWEIEPIGLSILLGGSYITNNKANRVMEAKLGDVGEQNSIVQTYRRWTGPQQNWEIERLNNGRFHIKNMRNRRFMLKVTNSNSIVLDDATSIASQWYFVKI